MFKLPKLAKGGIIDNSNNFSTLGKKGKGLFYDKYYQIYKRTKNRRIKKKQVNKSWLLRNRDLIGERVIPIDKLKIYINEYDEEV